MVRNAGAYGDNFIHNLPFFFWFLVDRRIVSEMNGTAARQLGAGKKDARTAGTLGPASATGRDFQVQGCFRADRFEQDTGTYLDFT